MTDPADRTYPTTVTRASTTSYTSASATTIDQVTFIDPWPISPAMESFPYTMTQTRITARTVLPRSGATDSPATITTTAYATYILWTIVDLDMEPDRSPACAGPGNCNPPAIKPTRCEQTGRETRCATQCELRDWLWFCLQSNNSTQGALTEKPEGRSCYAKNGQWEQLLEPCDHTDYAPGCKPCVPRLRDDQW